MGIDVSRLGPAAQRQVLQKLQQGGRSAQTAPSKMGNQKTQRVMPNGSVHTFDSQREARRIRLSDVTGQIISVTPTK